MMIPIVYRIKLNASINDVFHWENKVNQLEMPVDFYVDSLHTL